MVYSAYEREAGGALASVQSYCRHATLSGSFGQQTIPTLEEVEEFLTQSFYEVQSRLAQNGYATDQSNADDSVIGILQELNVILTCISVETSLPTVDWTGNNNARFNLWIQRRDQLFGFLVDGSLDPMGAEEGQGSVRRKVIVTGMFKADKKAIEDNDLLVPHQVRRGQFNDPGAISPSVRQEL